MTNIYFCDVCNESVPQVDLDMGRAIVVKGRIICSACDRAMTLRAEARGQSRPVTLGVDLDAGSEPVAAGIGEAPAPGTHAAVSHAANLHRPRSSGGSGVAFATGFVALTAVGALSYWTYQEFRRRDDEAARASQLSVVEQATARRELERVGEELREAARAAGLRLDESIQAAGLAGDAARAEQQALISQMGAQLAEFDRRLGELDTGLQRIARHDSELVTLQQHVTAFGTELSALGARVDEMAKSVAAGASTLAPPPPEPEQRPAWFDLTGALKSPNTADRWQALMALGETRDPSVTPYVAPLLHDADIFIRMAAARVLGDLASPVGVDPLIDALGDVEAAVRESAIDALRRITKRDLEFDPQASESERSKRAKQWREWWTKEREKLGV